MKYLIRHFVILALLALPSLVLAAEPLTQAKIVTLIKAGLPDEAVAAEIRERGIDFPINKDSLQQLDRAGVGENTIKALEASFDLLGEAKTAIPLHIKQIYTALNDGNPSQVAHLLDPQIAKDGRVLDAIVKPFNYKAHLVERIHERPGPQFWSLVRLLDKANDEYEYMLVFSPMRRGPGDYAFVLQSIRYPTRNEFDATRDEVSFVFSESDRKQAVDLVRRFVYALSGGQWDQVRSALAPRIGMASLTSATGCLQKMRQVSDWSVNRGWLTFDVHYADGVLHDKGLRYFVSVKSGGDRGWSVIDFYVTVEKVDGDLRIIEPMISLANSPMNVPEECVSTLHRVQDPNRFQRTLNRYGLAVTDEEACAADPACGVAAGELQANDTGVMGTSSPVTNAVAPTKNPSGAHPTFEQVNPVEKDGIRILFADSSSNPVIDNPISRLTLGLTETVLAPAVGERILDFRFSDCRIQKQIMDCTLSVSFLGNAWPEQVALEITPDGTGGTFAATKSTVRLAKSPAFKFNNRDQDRQVKHPISFAVSKPLEVRDKLSDFTIAFRIDEGKSQAVRFTEAIEFALEVDRGSR